MRFVAFACAVLLGMVTMVWVAATSFRRYAEKGDAGTTAAEGTGLILVVVYALGAFFALTHPTLAFVTFALCGVVSVCASFALEAGDLLTLGAGAVLPAASSLLSLRQPR